MPKHPGRTAALVAAAAALLGFVFAAYSTYDYAQQLDRQVHAVHCSFVPGMPVAENGANACKTALFSPYSALFRATWWGGVPISLFALGSFAFFAAFGVYLALSDRRANRGFAFYAIASCLPVVASLVMLSISATRLHVFCKLCVGIYVSSLAFSIAAFVAWRSRTAADLAFATTASPQGQPQPSQSLLNLPLWAGALALASVLPAVAYVALLPNYRPLLDKCGQLKLTTEAHKGLLKIPTSNPVRPVLLFEDPLCPTCKAFHERMVDEGVFDRLDVTLVMFPLDSDCNWMLDSSLHPGACVLAKAVICGDGTRSRAILEWAFDNQDELRELGKQSAAALEAKVGERWGADMTACLHKTQTTTLLTQQLHFAANNHIPVSTPQMFLGDKRICDEDTDLGLKYTLAQLAPEVLP